MAERVHQNTLPLSNDPQTTSSEENAFASNATPKPPAASYIIQLPKDQIYRVPPPENARRYQNYTRKKNRRSCCCLCWLTGILFILIMLVTFAACVFYLFFRPELPKFSIDGVAVQGMNLTSSLSTISPEFVVSVSYDNGNDKIGIYYEKGSIVEMFYRDIKLCNAALPAFYQPSNSVTLFQTVLKGNAVALARSDRRALVSAVAKRSVPLTLKLRIPLKFKVGPVKTGQFLLYKLECDLRLDQLTAPSKIVDVEYNFGFYLGSG